jgi:molecular chaperone GrpE
VKVIETVGKPYHYDLHEALGSVETDEHPEGTVVEELQRGYTWHGKVLRPARVRIAKAKTAVK